MVHVCVCFTFLFIYFFSFKNAMTSVWRVDFRVMPLRQRAVMTTLRGLSKESSSESREKVPLHAISSVALE